jgi:hypothetical protein
MKILVVVIAAIMAVGLLVSCTISLKEANMATKSYELKDFTKIEVGGAFEVDVEYADTYQVSVTDDDFPHVRVEKVGDTLVIKRQGIEWFAPFHGQPKAKVTLPVLNGLEVSGASHGKFINFHSDNDLAVTISGASQMEARNISAGKVSIKVSGASTLNGDLKAAKDTEFEATGASKIELAGVATSAVMVVNGASKAELGNFALQNASLKVSGASNVLINLNGKLDANVSGASNLFWLGSPVMGDIQTSGASNLRKK